MKNTFGTSVSITLFGESHGEAIGAVLDGMAPGVPVDEEFIKARLSLRRPMSAISTGRSEPDPFKIVSGVFHGFTTGTPICIVIPNMVQKSSDYKELYGKARPGHADYTAYCKYHGFEDPRGGGHFSGRITAAVVAAGAIALSALSGVGISVGTHIARLAGINDRPFGDLKGDLDLLKNREFGVLDETVADSMTEKILAARKNGDSVGGILETAVLGVPAGVGEPWFDTVESLLSHALFGIPAVKGVSFGLGFGFAGAMGSEANDSFTVKDGNITTKTNHNGGINGGITNGCPILFQCAVKPTPSISLPQETVDFKKNENTVLSVGGRHDPCIVHRARPVVESITALTLCDLLTGRFGTDYLGAK